MDSRNDETLTDRSHPRRVHGRRRALATVGGPGPPELAELIHRSATTDEGAFAELYDATASRVYGLAVRVLQSPARAEDVALASYLEVWRSSRHFRADRCSALAWVSATALRQIADQLASDGGATYPPAAVPALALGEHVGVRGPTSPADVDQLMEALAQLSPGERRTLELACRDGFDPEGAHLTAVLTRLVLRVALDAPGGPS
jgi:RNA polymerase sigma-70 factor (ECF subfamily)